MRVLLRKYLLEERVSVMLRQNTPNLLFDGVLELLHALQSIFLRYILAE